MDNPISIQGLAFLEFASKDTVPLKTLFKHLGFELRMSHSSRDTEIYAQNEITFLLSDASNPFAGKFVAAHGPSIPAMGWMVKDANRAHEIAIQRGAKSATGDLAIPALEGIGGSLIYLVDSGTDFARMGFVPNVSERNPSLGFQRIDHLTNNVPNGTMDHWANFYKDIFGFQEIRYFDIKGKKTGLTSFALKSPCGTFSIPINEAKDERSQINEYLREYNGAGVQHIALSTSDILSSLRTLRARPVRMLDIDPTYYEEAFQRVPQLSESKQAVTQLGVLIDGNAEGYLLQIFTQNAVGPIFFEFIQRKNFASFGEGNFGALFRSIERDQEKRGVL